jgi:two-component system, NarL family, sensor histidine kinase EvgS
VLESQVPHLMDLFGSAKKVHEVLRGLLDAGRQDVVKLDSALLAGDVQEQRDLLHRISGALCLLENGRDEMDSTQGNVAQQRDTQVRRLDALETLVHQMEQGSLSDDVLT